MLLSSYEDVVSVYDPEALVPDAVIISHSDVLTDLRWNLFPPPEALANTAKVVPVPCAI